MKIVIDISEDVYTRLFDNGDIDAVDMLKACVAIRKGTVLPRCHGNLKDEKEIYKKFYCRCLAGVAREVLEEVPPIIEANTESEIEDEDSN